MPNKNLLEEVDAAIASIENKEQLKKHQLLRIVQRLEVLRRKRLKLIEKYQKRINEETEELIKINDGICQINGHVFQSWEEHRDKYLDRLWYYSRKCQICGKEETIFEEPTDYIVVDKKTGQSYQRKKANR